MENPIKKIKKLVNKKPKQDKPPVNQDMQAAFNEAKAKKNGTYKYPKHKNNKDCVATNLSQFKQLEAKVRRELQKAQARGGEPEWEMVNSTFIYKGSKKPKTTENSEESTEESSVA